MENKLSTRDYLVLTGKLHGKTIELEEATDLPDGLEILVAIRLKPGDGVRLSAGGWADMTPVELRGRPINIPKIER